MKKILAIILTVALLVSGSVFASNAAMPPQRYGDVDSNNDINILDVTAIQRSLAFLEELDTASKLESADVDGNSFISIFDATIIQKYIARTIERFPAGEFFNIGMYLYSLTPNYISGKAMVGVPVTFTVSGYAHPEPTRISLIIDGEKIEPNSDNNYVFTHTFTQAGIHNIYLTMSDKWGYYSDSILIPDYEVVEANQETDKPSIFGITRSFEYTSNPTFTVDVAFGSAPYQYEYLLVDSENNIVDSQDYSDSNTYSVEVDYFETYDLYVTVKDANGNTDSTIYTFMQKMLAPA